MIKAIIFDCFGVLTTDGWLPFKDKHFADNPDRYREATDLNKQVDAGFLDYSQYMTALAELAGVDRDEVVRAVEGNQTNHALFDYIATDLKPHYTLAVLSNVGSNRLDQLFDGEKVGLFDAVSLSCDTGFVKPDPRAYQSILQKLELPAAECVFIDDQERFCAAARAIGMQAIVYRDLPQFKHDLSELLAG